MAPLRDEEANWDQISWALATAATLTSFVVVWTVCACCSGGEKKERMADDLTQQQPVDSRKLLTDAMPEKSTVVGVSQSLNESELSSNSGSEEKSFPTVFAMQIPKRKRKETEKPAPTPAAPSRKETSPKRSMLLAGVSSSVSRSVSVAPSNSRSSVSVVSAPTAVRSAYVEKSSSTFQGNYPTQVMAVVVLVVSLLFSSSAGKVIANEDRAEIGLTICHTDTGRNTTRPSTYMRQFVNAIAEQWPIDEQRTTVGIYQVATNETLILSIFDGNTSTALRNATHLLMADQDQNGNPDYQNRSRCLTHGLESGRKKLSDDLQRDPHRHRRVPAKVFIGVTVFRTGDAFTDESDWKRKVFAGQATEYLTRGRKHRSDVYLVFEAGRTSFYGVLWTLANDSVGNNCCGNDPNRTAETVFDAVREVMRICMLDENEQCYSDANKNCLANVTYKPAYAPGDDLFRYCDERAAKLAVNCSMGMAGCGTPDTRTSTIETSAAQVSTRTTTTSAHQVAWTWLGPCLAAIIIAGTVAIVAAVRQCVIGARQRRLEKQRLAECGMVCVPKTGKKSGKLSRRKALEMSAMTRTDSKMTTSALMDTRVGAAVLNRTSIRSVKSLR